MSEWPQHPIIYEINAWTWLHALSARYGHACMLGTVPKQEWDTLAELDIDAVWLMGVWERSPLGRRIALENSQLRKTFQKALPDLREDDVVGSPYCVRNYTVDAHLGGAEGLAVARTALAARGLKLILDYVPNHVALDHPWVAEHPEYFVQGDADELRRAPHAFYKVGDRIIARGRDPNFPPWEDVGQLNAYAPQLRKATVETLNSIAAQCDGMRCDMAILLMNDVFVRTWGDHAGKRPASDFWPQIIGGVRKRFPEVLFIAEAYWDLEWALQQQGFDFCYDKRLYDRLVHENSASLRAHLRAGLDYQQRLVRFIENHDEPRAAATLVPKTRQRAAAVVACTLPGATLLHRGQLQGVKVQLPVFLRRAPDEPVDEDLVHFYRQLLHAIKARGGLRGRWELCEARGWPDNQSCDNLLAWSWHHGPERLLIVVNYSQTASQGRIAPPWEDLATSDWLLNDPINGVHFPRDGSEIANAGLYVALEAWHFHYLEFAPVPKGKLANFAERTGGNRRHTAS